MLQKNPVLESIGKAVTNRILSELEKLAGDDKQRFEKAWEAFGPAIKEGIYEDAERRDQLYKVARFRSSTAPKEWRSLADYIAALRPNQTAIYYALGEDTDAILAGPHLEGFARRGIEVLLLADPVDAFWVRTALGYEGKPFQSVTQGAADLSSIPVIPVAEGAADAGEAASESAVATLAARFKQILADRVSEVRSSSRLTATAVCLVAPDTAYDRRLEKILSASDQIKTKSAPILELNPSHGLIKALAAKATSGGAAADLDDAAIILYGEARILDGEMPDDPADHARRVGKLLEKGLG
jgi:molecular chaperone HtpG